MNITMYRIRESIPSYIKSRIGKNLYEIRFKSPVNTFNQKNDTVYCLLNDSPDRDKICILVHGLGMKTSSRWDEFLRYIPEEMGGCLIDLPYHRHRTTGKKLRTAFYDSIFSLTFFRQGVLDIIYLIDILKDMGYKQIDIIGISLGSFFSLISMGLDKRIEKGVLILCGGDQGIITWKSLAMMDVRKKHKEKGITSIDCKKCRSFFPDFLKIIKEGIPPDHIKSDVICFYFDPLSFAPMIDSKKVLMINALFDFMIPRESTIKLRQALDEPLTRWLPSGHLSLRLFRTKIISYIRSFLLYY